VAFSPDGKTVIATGNGRAQLWETSTGQPIGVHLTGVVGEGKDMAFSPDGKTVAFAGGETVQLWETSTGQPIGQPLTGHSASVEALAFSPDGTMIAAVADDGTVEVWETSTGKPIGEASIWDDIIPGYALAFTPDGKMTASAGWEEPVPSWEVAGKQVGNRLTGTGGAIYGVLLRPGMAFSRDAKLIASAGDQTVWLWNSARRDFSPMRQDDPLPSSGTSVVIAGMVLSVLASLLAAGVSRLRILVRLRRMGYEAA